MVPKSNAFLSQLCLTFICDEISLAITDDCIQNTNQIDEFIRVTILHILFCEIDWSHLCLQHFDNFKYAGNYGRCGFFHQTHNIWTDGGQPDMLNPRRLPNRQSNVCQRILRFSRHSQRSWSHQREKASTTGMAIWVVEFSNGGIQNSKVFCLKINIPKGNYWILKIGPWTSL